MLCRHGGMARVGLEATSPWGPWPCPLAHAWETSPCPATRVPSGWATREREAGCGDARWG